MAGGRGSYIVSRLGHMTQIRRILQTWRYGSAIKESMAGESLTSRVAGEVCEREFGSQWLASIDAG